MNLIKTVSTGPAEAPISPLHEMGAYEKLWLEEGAWFKSIAEKFASDPNALPSDFVPASEAIPIARQVIDRFAAADVDDFGIRINHAGEYPLRLRDARHPLEVLYFRGTWELSETRSVAVVGSRKPSDDGIKRAQYLSKQLVENGFTVGSNLCF